MILKWSLFVIICHLSSSNGVLCQGNRTYGNYTQGLGYTKNIEDENTVSLETYETVEDKNEEEEVRNEVESDIKYEDLVAYNNLQVAYHKVSTRKIATHNLSAFICQIEAARPIPEDYYTISEQEDFEAKLDAVWRRVGQYGRFCKEYCCSVRNHLGQSGQSEISFNECGIVEEAYAPCKFQDYRAGSFPDCCPRLNCPPYYTYLDAFVYTISLIRSGGKAKRIYGVSVPPARSCKFTIPSSFATSISISGTTIIMITICIFLFNRG